MGQHWVQALNSNGKVLTYFISFNDLKIRNSYFKHKKIYKYTWYARGLQLDNFPGKNNKK